VCNCPKCSPPVSVPSGPASEPQPESGPEQTPLGLPLSASETLSNARAAYASLLFTFQFLRSLGNVRSQDTLAQSERVLAATAERIARRLEPEVERFRQAIERCEEAEALVN
jgi:hypothetical protein